MKDQPGKQSISLISYVKKSCVFLTICILASCHDVKKQQHIDQINTLLATADSIENVWELERTDPVQEILSDVYAVQDDIRENYNSDTISIEFSQKLEDYKMIAKGLEFYLSNEEALTFGTKQVKLTLNKLKHDIEEASGDRSKYAGYIAFEKNKVDQLNVLLKKNVETKTKCVNSYQRLHAEIKEFSETK